jgi:Trk K+ transport system NAD-binding subunit
MAIADGAVLICGLGALGQACLERLLPFDLPLTAVDLQEPRWRRHELSQRLCVLVQGDMRQARVLEQAGIRHCRAVLLLSADSQVNLEAALQVRLLNPDADVVVRSSSGQAAIGHLLEQRLPKVAVVDPVVLTAGAVACAIQPDEELIPLDTDGQGDSISVVNSIEPPIARPARRLRMPQGIQPKLWITLRQRSSSRQPRQRGLGQLLALARTWRNGSWQGLPRPQLRGLFPALLAVVATGLVLFSAQAGDWRRGLLVTFGLLQGEYVDPVMLLKQPGLWHLMAALSFSLLGTLITSTLVALILERLLSERLGLQRSERLRSGSRQVLIVDGEDVVEPIRGLLASERIGVQTASLKQGLADLDRQLQRLRESQLVGIGLLSPNLLANVHAALSLQMSHRACRLAVLAHEMDSSDQLGALLGGITVISGMDLAADAFVATAFGERVERVLQIEGHNHLVVRYRLEDGDHLSGLSIARVENGYGLSVLSHRRSDRSEARAIPPLEWPLQAGDEISVLASLESLRRVECGQFKPPGWRVLLRVSAEVHERFLVQQCLARFLDLAPGQVQSWLDGRWHESEPLDHDLAEQLCRELQRLRVETKLTELPAVTVRHLSDG